MFLLAGFISSVADNCLIVSWPNFRPGQAVAC